MDLKEQEYVTALAKYGSITKAADSLYITQPTLSIFLNRLENRLGIRLFEKIGKKLVLTTAGELYVRRAKELLFIQDQFRSELSDLVSGVHGRLRFGIHSRRSSYLLGQVLSKFRKEFPNIEIELCETSSPELERLLLEGSLDLILSNRFFETDQLTLFPIYQDTLVVALAADHPACQKAVTLPGHLRPWLDLKEIKDEFFILQYPHQATRVFTDRAFQYCGVTPVHSLMIQNMETAAQMAAEGVGAAFSMDSYARYFSYEKKVSFFETGDPDFSVQISVACRQDAHLPRYMELFIRLIRDNFNRVPVL